jgi:hypothetical protein
MRIGPYTPAAIPLTAGRIAPARPTQPSNPFHIARAYAAAPVAAVPTRSEGVERLVAGVVPGGISFEAAGRPEPTSAATLPFYTHPADRNAAATGVVLGRVLDVNG